MLSVCLCWHKLSAGWLASGRLPAVTFTMRVRCPYCEDATPLCIPPHILKPTVSHPQVKNRGIKCPRLSLHSLIQTFLNKLLSSHPICFIFRRLVLQLFTEFEFTLNTKPGSRNSICSVLNILL